MMNPVGKWKTVEMMHFNDEKFCMEWAKVEDVLATENLDKEERFMANMVMVFDEQGTITMLTSLPEGVSQAEVDAAVKAGEVTLVDGMMLMEERRWKAENGKIYTDTEPEGEVMGEKVGPWAELKEVSDGVYELMFMRIARVE